MTHDDKKRRPARVGSDTAHSWARNLRLRNSLAKLVLSMTTLYVNGDGACHVGVGQLSEDTELSEETVRRRLAWLEQIGAIVRVPQWVDENGRRNSEARGRRTSDEIRLMLDAETDEIEARAAGAVEDGDAVGPVPQRGLNQPSHTEAHSRDETASDVLRAVSPPVSPLAAPSLRTGPDSSNHEPEPIPPNPPRGTGSDDREGEGDSGSTPWPHTETWRRFEEAWTEPILHQQICRQVWSAFTDAERERVIRVARGYVAWRKGQRHPPNACNAQKILRERDAWAAYEKHAGPDPSLKTWVREGSQAYRALKVESLIGEFPLPQSKFNDERAETGIWLKTPLGADELALATFADKPIEQWTTLEPGSTPHHAWSARLRQWFGRSPESMRVPCLYPPRRDGTIGGSGESETHIAKVG